MPAACGNGVVIVAMKGIMGYSGFFWALFIADSPRMPPFPNPEGTVLSSRVPWFLVAAAIGGVAVAATVLLPVLDSDARRARTDA